MELNVPYPQVDRAWVKRNTKFLTTPLEELDHSDRVLVLMEQVREGTPTFHQVLNQLELPDRVVNMSNYTLGNILELKGVRVKPKTIKRVKLEMLLDKVKTEISFLGDF